MRVAAATLGVALTLVGGGLLGLQTLSTEHDQTQTTHAADAYDDQENATSVDSRSLVLPQEIVTVDTTQDNVPEAFNRARNAGKQIKLVSDQRYSVTVDPSLPMDSVTIIDVKSGNVLDTFPINTSGPIFR